MALRLLPAGQRRCGRGHEVDYGTHGSINPDLLRSVRRHERGLLRHGRRSHQYYWKGSNDFLVGTEIGQGLRHCAMNNPPQDGRSIDNAANLPVALDVTVIGRLQQGLRTSWPPRPAGTRSTPSLLLPVPTRLLQTPSTFNSGACGMQTTATDLGFAASAVTAAFTSVGVACSTGGGGGGGASTGGPDQWCGP